MIEEIAKKLYAQEGGAHWGSLDYRSMNFYKRRAGEILSIIEKSGYIIKQEEKPCMDESGFTAGGGTYQACGED